MTWNKRRVALDLALRAAGVLLLLIGWAALDHVVRHFPVDPRAPSFVDLMAATVAFLALSAASVAIMWGARLFDRVPVSDRWARRSVRRR